MMVMWKFQEYDNFRYTWSNRKFQVYLERIWQFPVYLELILEEDCMFQVYVSADTYSKYSLPVSVEVYYTEFQSELEFQ